MSVNGISNTPNADELQDLLKTVESLIIPYIQSAEKDSYAKRTLGHPLASSGNAPRTALVESHAPEKLDKLLGLDLPLEGVGKDGLAEVVQKVLTYSVNTWDEGFMDKLYASTNAIGVVSELLLAVLNTNVHVYQVSPALTMIEKYTARRLATLFGFSNQEAGGISQPGGSASNSSSIVIARNSLFPSTKSQGHEGRRFVLFTSAHGHYSIEKAAQMFGFGSSAVRCVPVNPQDGRMDSRQLREMVLKSKEDGEVPFYVNATAGTTVMGSYDPFDEIADICQEFGMWLHIDGSWGGCIVFNQEISSDRLKGAHRADSIAVTPHKMLGVPMTCSYLLGKDMTRFWKAMTLPAGYLFHNDPSEEIYDLADLTPQCGRRGDALKLFLSWSYYGSSGFSTRISSAFARAEELYTLLESDQDFELVSKRPLPCLQVCFYYKPSTNVDVNGKRTAEITARLVRKGWMLDYAPGPKGEFFRVVVNAGLSDGTCRALVNALKEVGEQVVRDGL
ncbi:pyridoxal phosphate-dependent transferase [Naematelia encephala]|uniref:Pyridoxal phosphate-dependent transferase n=1 Tax=Naematelia encephala TaxID=71784 RepID=A0A1Y2AIY3_9TREE|nr:pyridoxal phosphate-dependent transferase [Naematelia encephala]